MKTQKCLLILSLIATMVLALFEVPALAFDAFETDITQGPCLVKIAEENFNAVSGTDLLNYTGNGVENGAEGWGATGWSAGSKWKSYAGGITTDLTSGVFGITNNEMGRSVSNKSGFELARNLDAASYIDLTKNMDYYITFRIPSITNAPYSSNQYLRLYSGTTSVLAVGAARNYAVSNFTVGSDSAGSRVGTRANDPYTFLVYVGARAGNEKDIVRIKAFNETDSGTAFTYSPQTWDSEASSKMENVIDSIHLSFSNGSGSKYIPKFDNICIKKSTPVLATVDAANYSNFNPVIGQTTTINVATTNALGNTQTVQSIQWFKDGETQPFLTGASYTIPNDVTMVGHLIRCKVVVKSDDATQTISTYWPVSGYIRDVMDIVNFNFIGTASQSSVTTVNGQLDATSSMKAYANIMKNATTTFKPQMIVAIYDSYGNLKSATAPTIGTIGAVGTVTTLSTIIYAAGAFNTGDYVKLFVWDSLQGVRPLKMNLNSPVGSYTFPGYPTF